MAYLPSLKQSSTAIEQLQSEVLMSEFQDTLQQSSEREMAAGMTLVGPHRDTLRFLVNGIDMSTYGSRGQQRTVIIALKLAEAEYIRLETGEHPVMLLDDVLSELDTKHRRQLLELTLSLQQVIITAVDTSAIDPSFLSQTTQFKVKEGNIEPV